MTACVTREMTAWGIPRKDIQQIRQLVRAQTSRQILSYERDPKWNSIHIWTRGDGEDALGYVRYTAYRVGNTWKVEPDVFYGQ
jgi:hypothetical protein